jgi:hypothetical protein
MDGFVATAGLAKNRTVNHIVAEFQMELAANALGKRFASKDPERSAMELANLTVALIESATEIKVTSKWDSSDPLPGNPACKPSFEKVPLPMRVGTDDTPIIMMELGFPVGEVIRHKMKPEKGHLKIDSFENGIVKLQDLSWHTGNLTILADMVEVGIETFQAGEWVKYKVEVKIEVVNWTDHEPDKSTELKLNIMRGRVMQSLTQLHGLHPACLASLKVFESPKGVFAKQDCPKGSITLVPTTLSLQIKEVNPKDKDVPANYIHIGTLEHKHCFYLAPTSVLPTKRKPQGFIAPYWIVKQTENEKEANMIVQKHVPTMWSYDVNNPILKVQFPVMVNTKIILEGEELKLLVKKFNGQTKGEEKKDLGEDLTSSDKGKKIKGKAIAGAVKPKAVGAVKPKATRAMKQKK